MPSPPLPDRTYSIPERPQQRGLQYPLLFWSLMAFSFLALVAGAWLLVQGQQAGGERPLALIPKEQPPTPAMDFQLAALDGKPMRLSDLRGQVVLLNFWATWCPPCKAEMPDLEALYRENGKAHDFIVIGVDVEEDQATVQAFARQFGLTFPLLPDSAGQVSNDRYHIRNLPTSFIIDRAGDVRYTWTGQLPRSSMLSMLEHIW